ncbi:hypothetical protein [Nonomuraea basaltis]|uniref:hypothetical protein n=1 Tax=Nonomuraea basaltis TaxID=2495887 RepID=UPI00110C6DAA|nr:hypothetical protein [Nonomuraea basaltis]TMR93384.1 hypothetical protein EJK15_39380 [Nonomuraea basaltis]
MTPEEETDALFDVLGRGEGLPDSAAPGDPGGWGDPAVRFLAALVKDVVDFDGLRHSLVIGGVGRSRFSAIDDRDGGRSCLSAVRDEHGDGGRAGSSVFGEVGQRRSSVSMTPST